MNNRPSRMASKPRSLNEVSLVAADLLIATVTGRTVGRR